MLRWVTALGAAMAVTALPAVAGAAPQPAGTNDVGGFRNVLPGGQGRTVTALDLARNQATGDVPEEFTDQLGMYTDLVFGAPTLTNASLATYFKSAGFGAPPDEIVRTATPRPGVTIQRDRFNVPHVYGDTREDLMFGAGYASAQDRMFLMDVLRNTGRGTLSQLVGPGTRDANLRMDAAQRLIADYSEDELQAMMDQGVRDAGTEGQVMKADLDAYVAGINKYIAEARSDPTKLPAEYPALNQTLEDWKATDTVAIASLIGGFFGRGGGAEARVSQALAAAEARFGRARGRRVFDDFRTQDDPEAPVTVRKRFPFDNPGRVNPRAVARLDLGSVEDFDVIATGRGSGSTRSGRVAPWLRGLERGLRLPARQSNALLVNANRSASGNALAVMGPQVGYYSPQILMEMDLHGPGIDARGATFPGISLYVLLGRGRDFAWSATTATTDVVDEFAEELCEPGGGTPTRASRSYVYKGECIPFTVREVSFTTPGPSPGATGNQARQVVLRTLRSVHGPIQSTATVGGKPVAIAEARSTYMRELDSAIAFKRLNSNEVRDAASFQQAMNYVNFAFNWFYVDQKSIAYLQSGWYPRRARGTDPSLPAWGTGAYDWRGFDPARFTSRRMPFSALPKEVDPAQGYLVNWNNKQAPGWRSGDDNWAYGPIHRSLRLEKRLRKALAAGKVQLADVAKVMEEAATVDLRGQEIYPLLRRVIGTVKEADLEALLVRLDDWYRRGAQRRDLDRSGTYDDSAAVALMDAWWPKLAKGAFRPVLGGQLTERIRQIMNFDQPPGPGGSAYFDGWWGYLSKDLRALLGRKVTAPFSRRYCGKGVRSRCRAMLVDTLRKALAEVTARFNSADPQNWRVPATCRVGSGDCDQIEFTTAGAIDTPPIPWQDRPTFQQAVEAQGDAG